VSEKRTFSDLVALIARLRDPKSGCPWDRAQDHRSLRPYLLEEAHELVAAIDSEDPEKMVDELGDVLLQVVLHSQIGAESGTFEIGDVIEAIASKLVRRHPHVFGDASGDLPSVYRRWQEIKESEGRRRDTQPTLVQAKRLLHTLEARGDADVLYEAVGSSTGEEQVGLRILAALLGALRDGFDPEIALLKGIERLGPEA
jgi:MazG family protein